MNVSFRWNQASQRPPEPSVQVKPREKVTII
ncbi:UNVERIFIED_CONTAM: hypothetical protein GTU68_041556 [Idotea baltica]|nr:hypothetical protein [Idotea baltica]